MENKIKELLDKTYELEGLLLLAMKRTDSTKELFRLILNKGKDINKLCHEISGEKSPVNSREKENDLSSFDDYSIDDDYITSKYKENGDKKYDNKSKPSNQRRGKLIFSINDRYRFRKELFNNSDIEFNNTVALIASMENFEEAENYFINEEGFDPSNKIVKEFLGIVKRYFE